MVLVPHRKPDGLLIPSLRTYLWNHHIGKATKKFVIKPISRTSEEFQITWHIWKHKEKVDEIGPAESSFLS